MISLLAAVAVVVAHHLLHFVGFLCIVWLTLRYQSIYIRLEQLNKSFLA